MNHPFSVVHSINYMEYGFRQKKRDAEANRFYSPPFCIDLCQYTLLSAELQEKSEKNVFKL